MLKGETNKEKNLGDMDVDTDNSQSLSENGVDYLKTLSVQKKKRNALTERSKKNEQRRLLMFDSGISFNQNCEALRNSETMREYIQLENESRIQNESPKKGNYDTFKEINRRDLFSNSKERRGNKELETGDSQPLNLNPNQKKILMKMDMSPNPFKDTSIEPTSERTDRLLHKDELLTPRNQ